MHLMTPFPSWPRPVISVAGLKWKHLFWSILMLIMQILLLKNFMYFYVGLEFYSFFLKNIWVMVGAYWPPPPAADVAGDRVNKEAEGEVELWRSRGKISGVLKPGGVGMPPKGGGGGIYQLPSLLAGLTCSLLHKKGAGVKSFRKSTKLSSSNISDILLFRTRIYDISTSKILFYTEIASKSKRS